MFARTTFFVIQAGSNVILTARREEALKQVAAACTAAHQESKFESGIGGKFATVSLDVGDKAAIGKLWEKVPSDLRQVDVLGKFQLRIDLTSEL